MTSDRLLLGDCRERLRELDPQTVDACVTSPPYAEQRKALYGGIPESEYPEWTVGWLAEVARVLKPQGSVLINIREHVRGGQISDYVHRTRLAVRAAGWFEIDELLWVKTEGAPMGRVDRPRRAWERILWFARTTEPWCDAKANGSVSDRIGGVSEASEATAQWRHGSQRIPGNGVSRSRDYFRLSLGANQCGLLHPAAYPPDLAAWMIRLVTPPGGTVLDPFMGSGSTGVACIEHGFEFVGCEVRPDYFAQAEERLRRTPRPLLLERPAVPALLTLALEEVS